jgi:predicted nuclease of predicted toxin-antitoxin system
LKRRSDASSELHEPLVFFLDRSLGKKKVAQALRQAGAVVEVHADHFPSDARDEDWLQVVGSRGWIVLTKDERIRYRPNERRALLRAGVRAFILTGRNLTGEEMGEVFVASLRRMTKLVHQRRGAFIAAVTRAGVRLVRQ